MKVETTTTPLVLTTGIYDLLKDHIRKKKLNKVNEEKLELELKHAKQVLRKDLPEDVVTVDTLVVVRDLETGEELERKFVSPQKARRKHSTTSILSDIGVATVGYSTKAIIDWDLAEGRKSFQIVRVAKLA